MCIRDSLYGLVMFDTMPFDDVSKVDQSEFLQAAIWGAVYQIQKRDNGLSDYEMCIRDRLYTTPAGKSRGQRKILHRNKR